MPIVGGRQETALNRVGCFQKISLEHSDGRTFIVQAEEAGGAPGTVLRLAVYESVSANKTFTGGVDFVFRADTTIANGYDDDEIVQLREWSADLRDDKIFITFIWFDDPNWHVSYMEYNIDDFTFNLIYSITPPLIYPVSCDIACSESGPLRDENKRNIGHGGNWVVYMDTDSATFDPVDLPQLYRTTFTLFLERLWGAPIVTGYNLTSSASVDNARGLVSLFDGGNEIYSVESFKPSAVANAFFLNCFPDLLTSNLERDGTQVDKLFWPIFISGAIDASSILYNFGTWDSCYIDRYNYQVQAKWLRNAAGTGWNLYIGRRNQNGVFVSNLIKQVDFAAKGITDIETEMENINIFPEVVLTTDENGKVYCIFAFPDPAANAFPGTGIGHLDGDPYTTIEMMSFDGDEIYDPQNLDIRTVWEGALEPTIQSLKHISAPHRTDSQGKDISDTVLWFSMRDNVNEVRYAFYRN